MNNQDYTDRAIASSIIPDIKAGNIFRLAQWRLGSASALNYASASLGGGIRYGNDTEQLLICAFFYSTYSDDRTEQLLKRSPANDKLINAFFDVRLMSSESYQLKLLVKLNSMIRT